MNRNAEYDSLRDLIAAHQNSEVEPRTASQAPSDAGREGTSPSLPSRPANAYPCDHCGQSFRSRTARGAHVASVHPYSKGKASYSPPEEKVTVIHHRSPYFGQVVA